MTPGLWIGLVVLAFLAGFSLCALCAINVGEEDRWKLRVLLAAARKVVGGYTCLSPEPAGLIDDLLKAISLAEDDE
jgi:hypothetical protein